MSASMHRPAAVRVGLGAGCEGGSCARVCKMAQVALVRVAGGCARAHMHGCAGPEKRGVGST
eukprot:3281139-Alexandrium_andersonii.AAC.1